MPKAILHLFFPHEHNNHRARILHPLPTLFLAVFLVLFQVFLPFLPRFMPVVLGYESSIKPEEIVELTNKEREEAGLPGLFLDPLLTQAALTKASDMFARNYWAHNSPDGKEPWRFITGGGYQYRFAGENLARDFSASEDVVSAWMRSSTHRDNLLSPKYQDIGVAAVEGELDGVRTTLVVQFFGTKMSQAALVEQRLATSPGVLSKVEEKNIQVLSGVLVPPASAIKGISLGIILLLGVVFLVDLVIVRQKNIARVSSKSLAHFLFFAMLLLVILVAKQGITR